MATLNIGFKEEKYYRMGIDAVSVKLKNGELLTLNIIKTYPDKLTVKPSSSKGKLYSVTISIIEGKYYKDNYETEYPYEVNDDNISAIESLQLYDYATEKELFYDKPEEIVQFFFVNNINLDTRKKIRRGK